MYAFFWVNPQRVNFIWRRFGTLSVPSSQASRYEGWLGLRNWVYIYGKSLARAKPFPVYKVVQIWPGLMRLVYTQISPGHIWTTLYIHTCLWRCNRQSVPKRRHLKTKTLGNYQEESKQHSEQLRKEKNQLDATYFIIYSILIRCSTCFGR